MASRSRTNIEPRKCTYQKTSFSGSGFEGIGDLSKQGHGVESVFIILRQLVGRAWHLPQPRHVNHRYVKIVQNCEEKECRGSHTTKVESFS